MRTKEEALEFFRYKAPDETTQTLHQLVTDWFLELVDALYDTMPDGPGKTVAIRKLMEARMSVHSAIANKGQ